MGLQSAGEQEPGVSQAWTEAEATAPLKVLTEIAQTQVEGQGRVTPSLSSWGAQGTLLTAISVCCTPGAGAASGLRGDKPSVHEGSLSSLPRKWVGCALPGTPPGTCLPCSLSSPLVPPCDHTARRGGVWALLPAMAAHAPLGQVGCLTWPCSPVAGSWT